MTAIENRADPRSRASYLEGDTQSRHFRLL
nr:MAG TPA: hypothetical protein [Caudoviricetes sp.]